MNMKEHILAALEEQFDRWERLLAGLGEEQITAPHFDFDWSIKDVMAHLWAWQQISIARMEGGLLDREPELPKWIVESNKDWEENADQTNAVTFEKYHNKPHGQRFIKIGEMDFCVSLNWEMRFPKSIYWIPGGIHG